MVEELPAFSEVGEGGTECFPLITRVGQPRTWRPSFGAQHQNHQGWLKPPFDATTCFTILRRKECVVHTYASPEK